MGDSSPNYPDILGYITGDVQATFGVVQAALAVSPTVVLTGNPFEVILLLQNLSDVHVKVVASLILPTYDAAGHKARITSRHHRRTVTLRPAEVGYLVMPAMVMPDAESGQYAVRMELQAETMSKPRRIRNTAFKGEVNLDYYFYLSEQTIGRIVRLKGLSFSANKSRLMGTEIEALFNVAHGDSASPSEAKVSWVRLWALNTHSDTRPLLERYHGALNEQVLPVLNRAQLYPPLFKALHEQFGPFYPVHKAELHFAAKLLIHVLEMAAQTPELLIYPQQSIYCVSTVLNNGWATDGSPIILPNWVRATLTQMDVDPLITTEPLTALTSVLFNDLLRDAILHGFRLIHALTGERLGSDSDARAYGEQLINALGNPSVSSLTFVDFYLPLVMGGILVAHETALYGESVLDALNAVNTVFEGRAQERNPDNEEIFKLADQCIIESTRGYHDWM